MINKISRNSVSRKDVLIRFKYRLLKIGMFHKAIIDKKELLTECSFCILRFANESRNIYQAGLCFEGNEILINMFSEYSYNSLPQVTRRKIEYFRIIMIKRKFYSRVRQCHFLEFVDYMPQFCVLRFKEFSSGRDIEKQALYRKA